VIFILIFKIGFWFFDFSLRSKVDQNIIILTKLPWVKKTELIFQVLLKRKFSAINLNLFLIISDSITNHNYILKNTCNRIQNWVTSKISKSCTLYILRYYFTNYIYSTNVQRRFLIQRIQYKNNLKAYNQNVFKTAVPKRCWKFAKNVKLQFEVW